MCPQRSLSARLVARRIAKARAVKKDVYNPRSRPKNWVTREQVFAAADAVIARNEAPTCGAVARQLGRTRTDNTVRMVMCDYWRDLWERLSSAGALRVTSRVDDPRVDTVGQPEDPASSPRVQKL